MTLVAGIDSSTQSVKVVVRQAGTGALARFGQAPHPDGTEVDPAAWWDALGAAIGIAGGLDDVAAVAVGGQQHGMVALDAAGEVIRPALLWNDTRSAAAAEDLIDELGDGDRAAGAAAWASAVGTVPVASLTITKLRWLRDAEPEHAARVAALALPHDWLTWKLSGGTDVEELTTDRSDASGTGYFDASADGGAGAYRPDLLARALGRDDVVLPRVLAPAERAGTAEGASSPAVLGPGAGDNAAAALALGLGPGDVALSVGTSGVVSAVVDHPVADPTGLVAGFADATGRYLPLAVTLNASQVLDRVAGLLGVDHGGLAELALAASPGAGGLVCVPYLAGERTPNKPLATGAFHGLTLGNATRENLARAAFEGVLCSLADGLDAVRTQGLDVASIQLVGGAARSRALTAIAPTVLGRPVVVPQPSEFVADGAARQAAWVLAGGEAPPEWTASRSRTYEAAQAPEVRERYARARELTVERS
ncbi:xylulokinase [Beutenbergia cavernae DSM 12333]|uniref:Xylulose kinase n=1 Tax=Beutenbergia cavernae (strain ATCC BAA-8 / DSM 12333 / CCUG 43141 / JCM 11478 / NBRC 16432 / NCIMB 13614 / HKI 0122) TaxID=471853 RepID=C5C1D9_BEUC1|nr:FGGY family carbohydrate kinase [Beutenbergia cavernae]ACQ81549.1 xylulokinase [Beutenbergia cavernae DSM 12333]